MADESKIYGWLAKYKWVFGVIVTLILFGVSAGWFLKNKDFESAIAVIGSLSAVFTLLFKKELKGLILGLGIVVGAALASILLFFIPQFGSEAIKAELTQARRDQSHLQEQNNELNKDVAKLHQQIGKLTGQIESLNQRPSSEEPTNINGNPTIQEYDGISIELFRSKIVGSSVSFDFKITNNNDEDKLLLIGGRPGLISKFYSTMFVNGKNYDADAAYIAGKGGASAELTLPGRGQTVKATLKFKAVPGIQLVERLNLCVSNSKYIPSSEILSFDHIKLLR